MLKINLINYGNQVVFCNSVIHASDLQNIWAYELYET